MPELSEHHKCMSESDLDPRHTEQTPIDLAQLTSKTCSERAGRIASGTHRSALVLAHPPCIPHHTGDDRLLLMPVVADRNLRRKHVRTADGVPGKLLMDQLAFTMHSRHTMCPAVISRIGRCR